MQLPNLVSEIRRQEWFHDALPETLLEGHDACVVWLASLLVEPVNETLIKLLCHRAPHHMPAIVQRTAQNVSNPTRNRNYCFALGLIVQRMPQLFPLCLVQLEKLAQFGQYSLLHGLSARSKKETSQWIARTAAVFIHFNVDAFRSLWDWAAFFQLVHSRDRRTRYCARTAVAKLVGMSGPWHRRFVFASHNEANLSDVKTEMVEDEAWFGTDMQAYVNEMDVVMSTAAMWKTTRFAAQELTPALLFPKDHAHSFTLNGGHADEASSLVPVNSTLYALESLTFALLQKKPILLDGPIGSGKTTVLHSLSDKPLMTLHFDDQLDSKTLLGTYACTEVPGEFVYQKGALTRAVECGDWVLLEDIDRASFEVISALLSLFETRLLFLPQRGEYIRAHPDFQLFATVTTASASAPKSESTLLLISYFTQITFPALCACEVQQIVTEKWPMLSPFVPQIMQVAAYFIAGLQRHDDADEVKTEMSIEETTGINDLVENEDDQQKKNLVRRSRSGRQLCTRDVFKWCRRLHLQCTASNERLSKEQCFHSAVDAFVAFLPASSPLFLTDVSALADIFGLVQDKLNYFLTIYKPRLLQTDTHVSVGRGILPNMQPQLPRKRNRDGELVNLQTYRPFSQTRHNLCMMERIMVGLALKEPILLVGTTGNGKTFMLQELARLCGKKLFVFNLNQETDAADLLGGYQPVHLRSMCIPIMNTFASLFPQTFSKKENALYLQKIRVAFDTKKFKALCVLIKQAIENAAKKFAAREGKRTQEEANATTHTHKKRRLDSVPRPSTSATATTATEAKLKGRWEVLAGIVNSFEKQVLAKEDNKAAFAFTFREGTLVQCLRNGDWILLDELNLASSETIQRIAGLLEEEENVRFSLTERGDTEEIKKHPEFRLLANMNPGGQRGKRELLPSVRSRFTELYFDDVKDPVDLAMIAHSYLNSTQTTSAAIDGLVKFYLDAVTDVALFRGDMQKPHFSLRTFCRALSFARQQEHVMGTEQALLEGFTLSFLTPLLASSRVEMAKKLRSALGLAAEKKSKSKKKAKNSASKIDIASSGGAQHVNIEGFWLKTGPEPVVVDESYILTPSVHHRLRDMARCVLSGNPMLLQGVTSAGKTSLIRYLAHATGHKFIRINNSEHTDLSEYFGAFVSNEHGQFVFQEGVLIQAMRKGHWVVLDELNLAPSEILEALNRLLDDNREIYLPETRETVKAHPDFLLFATQNPSAAYGGRKELSLAFQNRFVLAFLELVADDEMEEILMKSSKIPLSYCKIMMSVMKELKKVRESSNVFAGTMSFITPRDLFRWAGRRPSGKLELAEHGYMLLGERIRTDEGKNVVHEIIEKLCKVTLDRERMYECKTLPEIPLPTKSTEVDSTSAHAPQDIAWTASLLRLYRLMKECIANKEPVLLVGETGSGKTTICQLFSMLFQRPLYIVNVHQNTETGDFLGGLRPVRNKAQVEVRVRKLIKEYCSLFVEQDATSELAAIANDDTLATIADLKRFARELNEDGDELLDFDALMTCYTRTQADVTISKSDVMIEVAKNIDQLAQQLQALFQWQDGALITAMKNGHMLLLDEISLGQDAVLERLNSVLEPERSLLLSEKSGVDLEHIRADENFVLMATMNPGGDYGKKELSPALRNRFTEIYVPTLKERSDLRDILMKAIRSDDDSSIPRVIEMMLDMYEFLDDKNVLVSIRDLLAWVNFINCMSGVETTVAYAQGAELVLLDGFGIGTNKGLKDAENLKQLCLDFIAKQLKDANEASHSETGGVVQQNSSSQFGFYPFFIPYGREPVKSVPFSMDAPTPLLNVTRVLRALQLPGKAILLEGSPGVGKTSLVQALAQATGHALVRINLSEQTDIMDLLGSDLPVEDDSLYDNESNENAADEKSKSISKAGLFRWSDGVFLQAMKRGDWVLLDELNLASQSVLEGLNAVLDHRKEVFLPELNETVTCMDGFQIFACQNPVNEGGGRKGLPLSFLNRFTKVHLNPLTSADILFISSTLYSSIERKSLEQIIAFNEGIYRDTMIDRLYGIQGGPWEFNLRDIFRWCDLLMAYAGESDLDMKVDGAEEAVLAESLCSPAQYVDLLYLQRMRTPEDRQALLKRYLSIFGNSDRNLRLLGLDESPRVIEQSDVLLIGPAQVPLSFSVNGSTLAHPTSYFSSPQNSIALFSQQRKLQHVAQCVQMQWPSLLIGPSRSGKKSVVRRLASMSGNMLEEFLLTSSVDSSELLGCFEQVDVARHKEALHREIRDLTFRTISCLLEQPFAGEFPSATGQKNPISRQIEQVWSMWYQAMNARASNIEIQVLSNLLDELGTLRRSFQITSDSHESSPEHLKQVLTRLSEMEDQSFVGRFEWVDGKFLAAIEHGHWVMLNNVNFASASVLDRLNPLLETKTRSFLVNESGNRDGSPRIVQVHKNFRIFFTMNERFGPVSRAMRNRCVELVFDAPIITETAVSARATPEERFLALRDVFGMTLAKHAALGPQGSFFLTAFHATAVKDRSVLLQPLMKSRGWQPDVRNLEDWMCLAVHLFRNENFSGNVPQLLWVAFCHTYHVTYRSTCQTCCPQQDAVLVLCQRFLDIYRQCVYGSSINMTPSLWPTLVAREFTDRSSRFHSVKKDAQLVEFLIVTYCQQQQSALELQEGNVSNGNLFVRLTGRGTSVDDNTGAQYLSSFFPLSTAQCLELLPFGLRFFVRASTGRDWFYRYMQIMVWRQDLSQLSADSHLQVVLTWLDALATAVMQVCQSNGFQEMLRARAEVFGIESACGLNDVLNAPEQYRALLATRPSTLSMLSGRFEQVDMKLKRVVRSFFEQKTMKNFNAKPVASLSPLEQSFAILARTLDERRAAHPSLKLFAAFFNSLDSWMDSFLDQKWSADGNKSTQQLQAPAWSTPCELMFRARDRLWDMLNLPGKLNFVAIQLHWALFSQHLQTFSVDYYDEESQSRVHLLNLSTKIDELLMGSEGISSLQAELPIDEGRVVLPRSTSLRDLAAECVQLGSELSNSSEQAEPLLREAKRSKNLDVVRERLLPQFQLDAEWKLVLLDAVTNIKCMSLLDDTQTINTRQKMLRSLSKVPLQLKPLLQNHRAAALAKYREDFLRFELISDADQRLLGLGLDGRVEEAAMESNDVEQFLLFNRASNEVSARTFVSLLSLHDIWFLKGLALLVRALFVYASSTVVVSKSAEHLESLVDWCRAVISFALTHSSIAIESLVGVKHCEWLLSAAADGELLKTPDLRGALSDTIFALYDHLWQHEVDFHSLALSPEVFKFCNATWQCSIHDAYRTRATMKLLARGIVLDLVQSRTHDNLSSSVWTERMDDAQLVAEDGLRHAWRMLSCLLPNFADEKASFSDGYMQIGNVARVHSILQANEHVVVVEALPLLSALIDTYVEVQTRLANRSSGFGGDLMDHVSRMYVLLGLCRFSLLSPASAMDPVDWYNALYNDEVAHGQELNTSQLAYYAARLMSTGQRLHRAVTLRELEMERAKSDHITRLAGAEGRTCFRTDTRPAFGDLFSKIQEFQTLFLQPNKVLALLETDAKQAAEVFEGSAGSFVFDVQDRFSAYADVTQPLLLSLFQVKQGLRLKHSHIDATSTGGVTSLIRGLARFPLNPTEDVAMPWDLMNHYKYLSKRVMICQLMRASFYTVCGSKRLSVNRHFRSVRNLIHVLSQMWTLDKERRQRALEEEKSLYVEQRHGEEPQEEMSVVREYVLFWQDKMGRTEEDQLEADRDADNEELRKAEQAALEAKQKQSVAEAESFTSADVDEVYNAFSVISNALDATADKADRLRSQAASKAYEMACKLAASKKKQMQGVTIGSEPDGACVLGHLFTLTTQARALRHDPRHVNNADDEINLFKPSSSTNREGIKAELCLMNPILSALLEQLHQILEQFPHHPLLLQLVRVSYSLCHLPLLTTPILKALTGLELLLKKAEKWESYAHAKISLGTTLKQVNLLVSRWRRMELRAWKNALGAVHDKFRIAARSHFFRLCQIVFDAADGELFDVFRVLNEFVLSSSIGQLPTRLKMLRDFSNERAFAVLLPAEMQLHPKLISLRRIFATFYAYYQPFMASCDEMLSSDLSKIEKQMKEEVLLCSWDASTYFTLSASCAMSHQKIVSLTKQYTELMAQSFRAVVTAQANKEVCRDVELSQRELLHAYQKADVKDPMFPEFGPKAFKQNTFLLPSSTAFERENVTEAPVSTSELFHLANLPRLFGRMRRMVSKGLLSAKSLSLYVSQMEAVRGELFIIVSRMERFTMAVEDFKTTVDAEGKTTKKRVKGSNRNNKRIMYNNVKNNEILTIFS